SQRGPVIHKLVVDEVFWLPHGYTYDKVHGDARYELLMRRFVSDLGGTPYYNIVTQYPDSTKVAPSNSVKLDDSVVDTTNRYPNDVPLTRKDVSSEVHRMVVKRHWKEDGNHLFIVFTGKGIRVYKGADAYHDAFYDGSTLTYFAAIPIEAPIKGASPNADPQADGEGDALSHEIFEAVTDPAYHFKVAWRDINKQEIGDKCQTNAADPPRNAQGANIYLHGHPYKIGSRWSNDVSGCTPDLCGKSDCGLPLRLTLTAAATTPAGASISYSFNTKNTSDTNASTSTTVTDILPAGLTYKAGSSNSPVTVNGQTLTWSRGTLAVHDTWSVTFQATPNNSLTGTTVKNCAQLTHNDAIGRPVLDLIGASCASTAVQP
ncbi:MAG TPA: hypothetical protein VN636_07910, partial [Acidimicrobiia bacterium]|nr:hypothetical protein [Acidimicrobiia bacterium]